MNKDTVIQHYEHSIEWAKSLMEVTDEEWRRAIADGKWSTAEIIAHFVPWDEFILKARLKEFGNDQPLPQAPDVHKMNQQSAERARKEKKSETIVRFIAVRTELLQEMKKIEPSRWNELFFIGQTKLTLLRYFQGLIEHDIHHMKQVTKLLSQTKTSHNQTKNETTKGLGQRGFPQK
ncbi:DinB family protein [Bacillus safensis]|uniref:DinB family protein n=1 Tax=Bacillus TaxID=1386 RepID=UPI00203ABE19|nr:DinB family protein [Bacillus safensis]MCM2987212.1 DinB family protein [Bacillus safensis]MCY7447987.1 DinB family protein [Bacillus safensis]MCY7458904.1 DinB family protein [Bacillus safensis]MDP4567242.1 DinB family protein [Bacillus safensis]